MHETKVRAAHRRIQIPTLTFRTPFTGQSEFLPFIFRACYNLHASKEAAVQIASDSTTRTPD